MEITFTKAQMEVLTVLTEPPFNLSRHWRSARWSVDLSKFSSADIEHLKDETERFSAIRGMPGVTREIDMWLQLQSNTKAADEIRITSTKKADTLFFHFFSNTERKHVYRCVEEEDITYWLPYLVSSIKYHEREDYSPEHVTFNLAYYLRGEVLSTSFSMYREDLVGKTCRQALEDIGVRVENQVLREVYLDHLETYDDTVNCIGKQFLAIGIGESAGVDDRSSTEDRFWGSYVSIRLDKDGVPTPVVIDVEKETDKASRSRSTKTRKESFWRNNDSDEQVELEIPVHPYVTIFLLRKHMRLKTHISNLTPYSYDGCLQDKLVLPVAHTRMIDALLKKTKEGFSDVVKNKAGGVVVLSQGLPGTGKTLTAEIYSESLQRPLYAVQCSQLGLSANELEKNLSLVLDRGNRWGAVTLLDEADVYIHHRGNDLEQNAIVGVFLRVLEYQTGVLFLTTNRGELVDDAILSRCTVRIPYGIPTPEDQKRIWKGLAQTNSVELSDIIIYTIVNKHNDLSGRDIKNLFKLCVMVYGLTPSAFTPEIISEMRVYKATSTS